jgi:hypothetical protein
MKDIAGSVGKVTGKTVLSVKKLSKKTVEVTKEAPRKTTSKVTEAKEQFLAGFRSEIPYEQNTKIGDVDNAIPTNITITQ